MRPTRHSLSIGLLELLEPRSYFAVDLSGAVSLIGSTAHQLDPGQQIEYSVEVTNSGNKTAKGSLKMLLSLSSKSNGASPFDSATVSKAIDLAPGAEMTFHVRETIPLGSKPGVYFAVADVDSNNAFGESNLKNNTAVSSQTVTVLDPYPDLLGNWTGTGTRTINGASVTLTETDDFTSESDTTGNFKGTGTYSLSSGVAGTFAFHGTISPDGQYSATGSDTPTDATGIFHVTSGELSDGILTITFRDDLGTGEITLTRAS